MHIYSLYFNCNNIPSRSIIKILDTEKSTFGETAFTMVSTFQFPFSKSLKHHWSFIHSMLDWSFEKNDNLNFFADFGSQARKLRVHVLTG